MDVKFIHIGCHKAGSSFLQEEVLPKLKGITPVTFFEDSPVFKEIEYLIRCADLYYDEEWLKSSLNAKLSDFSNICISSEGFCGADTAIFGTGLQLSHVAQRLRSIFGATNILLGIRSQKKILPSLYKDDIRYGYLMSFEQWVKWRTQTYGLNYFKFSRLIECYYQLFGRENVKVVLFEDLFKPETIMEILTEFNLNTEGVDDIDFNRQVNSAYSVPNIAITKILNRFSGSKLTHGVLYGPSPLKLYNFWRYNLSEKLDALWQKCGSKPPEYGFEGYNDMLTRLYHDDNRRTSELLGKDLENYGYI